MCGILFLNFSSSSPLPSKTVLTFRSKGGRGLSKWDATADFDNILMNFICARFAGIINRFMQLCSSAVVSYLPSLRSSGICAPFLTTASKVQLGCSNRELLPMKLLPSSPLSFLSNSGTFLKSVEIISCRSATL